MQYADLAQDLLTLRKKDLEVRQRLIEEGKLFVGYATEMEEVHLANAKRLQEIISKIGYPTIDKVGSEASQAAWLIIQHAISLPDFMKNCLALAQQEAAKNKIGPVHVAFLSDRIAMYENRPQAYGTQFIRDEAGELTPYRLEGTLAVVNQKRQGLGLNTVEERLEEMRQQAQNEKEPERTSDQRRKEQEAYDNWRRKVGWLK
ncbi:hypothetical protein OB13_08505 [Pontibacter sp. HJ8]